MLVAAATLQPCRAGVGANPNGTAWAVAGALPPFSGVASQVAITSPTTCLLSGGVNGASMGTYAIDATAGTMNQTLSIKQGVAMIMAVAISSTANSAVAAGPALLGTPVSYSSADRGMTWAPSAELAKGFDGAVDIGLVVEDMRRDADGVVAFAVGVTPNS